MNHTSKQPTLAALTISENFSYKKNIGFIFLIDSLI